MLDAIIVTINQHVYFVDKLELTFMGKILYSLTEHDKYAGLNGDLTNFGVRETFNLHRDIYTHLNIFSPGVISNILVQVVTVDGQIIYQVDNRGSYEYK